MNNLNTQEVMGIAIVYVIVFLDIPSNSLLSVKLLSCLLSVSVFYYLLKTAKREVIFTISWTLLEDIRKIGIIRTPVTSRDSWSSFVWGDPR